MPAHPRGDEDLMAALADFPRKFRAGRIAEYTSLINEVIERGLPVSKEQHEQILAVLVQRLRLFRSTRAKTSKVVIQARKQPHAKGYLFPAVSRIQLGELILPEQAAWENTLRDSLQAWKKYGISRPKIGALRRRR